MLQVLNDCGLFAAAVSNWAKLAKHFTCDQNSTFFRYVKTFFIFDRIKANFNAFWHMYAFIYDNIFKLGMAIDNDIWQNNGAFNLAITMYTHI